MPAKMLKDHLDLSGEVETITVMDLRARPGDILTQTSLGKSYVVTRRGEAVAAVVPLDGDITHTVAPDGSCVSLGLSARKSRGAT